MHHVITICNLASNDIQAVSAQADRGSQHAAALAAKCHITMAAWPQAFQVLSGVQEALPAGQPESDKLAELRQRITRSKAEVEEASTLFAPAAAKSLLLMCVDADVTHVLPRGHLLKCMLQRKLMLLKAITST